MPDKNELPPVSPEDAATFIAPKSGPKDPADSGRPPGSSSSMDGTIISQGMDIDGERPSMPASIGTYRILGILGEGGMGIVYEAEQQTPRRRVALKVLRGGRFVDEGALRMFRREADSLARLRHPNIGSIYESGRTEDGQPFYAMELVRGDSLDVYLSKRPKQVAGEELRFRLSLFRRIAEAVHYAHQQGVIHRDLKPSNIIVTQEVSSERSLSTLGGMRIPEIKVLDFGLARFTEGGAQATQVTEVGVIKGTLPYMSPEQARGQAEAIDVRTDVYALGVILYEMLAGDRPYDVSKGSLVEAVRVICEEAPRTLRATLGGARLDADVQTIVGKALEKESDRRYNSAAALAEDVDRYLASQPILARPPSTAYQLSKFARRNRVLVGGVLATFLVLLVGAVVSTFQAMRAMRAEDLALVRLHQAQSAEAVAEARQRESEEARRTAEDRRVEAEKERTAAEAARHSESQQRRAAEAARLAEETQRKAAEASAQQARSEATKAEAIDQFLQDVLATADPWAGGGPKVTLETALQKAQERISTSFGSEPELDVAIRTTVSSAFEGVGRTAEAESLLSGAVQRLGSSHPGLAARLQCELGGIRIRAGKYAAAEHDLREALCTLEASGSSRGDTLAATSELLAEAMARQGKFDAADSLAGAALNQLRAQGADRAPAAADLYATQAYIASQGRGDAAGCDTLLGQGLKVLGGLPVPQPVKVADLLERRADNRVRMNDPQRADSLYRQAIALRRRFLGEDHPLVARAMESQSELYSKGGQLDRTAETLRQVLAIRQAGLGPESMPVGRTWMSLGSVYLQAGKPEEAADAFAHAIAIFRAVPGERASDLDAGLKGLFDARVAQDRSPAAEEVMRQLVALRNQTGSAGSPEAVDSQLQLATLLRDRKAFKDAEAILLQARQFAGAARGNKDPSVVRATQALVDLNLAWGKPKAAAKWRAELAQTSP